MAPSGPATMTSKSASQNSLRACLQAPHGRGDPSGEKIIFSSNHGDPAGREFNLWMVNLDGSGRSAFETGIPFLEHMLDQIARHGMLDLEIKAVGDLHIDDHHTVEDIGITLGQAVARAVGDRKGIVRYGHAYVPLDEALSRVVIDFSGRPGLEYHIPFTRAAVGGFDVDLFLEFFQGFVNHAAVTLHVDNLRGANAHHQAETVFKAFGRALRVAASRRTSPSDRTLPTRSIRRRASPTRCRSRCRSACPCMTCSAARSRCWSTT